jgi:hypothetical protein
MRQASPQSADRFRDHLKLRIITKMRRERVRRAIDCALRALRCAVAMIQSVTGNAVMVKKTLQTTLG